jgi:hypothetical protein
MQSLLQPDTPLGVRIGLSATTCVAVLYGAFAYAMNVDHPTAGALLATCSAVAVACLALGLSGSGSRPRLPLQLTIGLTMFASAYVLIGLPFPPRASSIGSQVPLIVVLILAGAVIREQERRPRRAFILLSLLAFVGALLAFSGSVLATRVVLPETSRFPMWQMALVIGASITSLWHGRALRVSAPGVPSGVAD